MFKTSFGTYPPKPHGMSAAEYITQRESEALAAFMSGAAGEMERPLPYVFWLGADSIKYQGSK